MKKSYPNGLFWFAEINLLLWLSSLGLMIMFELGESVQSPLGKAPIAVAISGMIIAALFQHWAYHNIYKPNKQTKNITEPVN